MLIEHPYLRIVLDTSIWVSYFLTKGDILSQVINAWLAEEFIVLMSPQTQAELLDVLDRQYFRQRTGKARSWVLENIKELVDFVDGTVTINGICRDPEDDMFLACAVEGNANYLISSEKDLLTLGQYEDICILNPGQFLVALQFAKFSKHEIQVRYSQETLQQIQDELCLDPETRSKLAQLV